ncbi:von Willebrand factor A [Achromatium sp. WMS3]|nr:von Willebrand factor A [Achromatium sp. WMS3]
MFEFYWPWMSVLLPLPLLVYAYWHLKFDTQNTYQEIGQRITLLHPHLEQLRASFKTHNPKRDLTNLLYTVLLALLWLLLVLSLMRPQWRTPRTEEKSPGYDLLLAIDASHSMEALDFTVQGNQVTRMQVVKGVMNRFIKGRKGDRIGLVIFGSQAFVLSPLTLDRNAVQQLLTGLLPNVAGQGTALGDAIALGTKKLRDRPEASRVMILVADGDSTNGLFSPLAAARLAARAGIRIYVIGVGSNKTPIPIYEKGEIRYRDDLVMDETTLKRIASITRGAYFRATDARVLAAISRDINELEKTQVETRTAFLPIPLYRWPLGLALIVLLILGALPEGRKRFLTRQPSRA